MIVQPAKLRSGPGSGAPQDGLCLMQMVDWFSGSDQITDHPKCASPALSGFAIYLNDAAPSQKARDELWPLTWKLIDSADITSEKYRAEHLVREAIHRLFAPLFIGEYRSALLKAQTMDEIRVAALAANWMLATRASHAAAAAVEAAAVVASEVAWELVGRAAAQVALPEPVSTAADWEIARQIFIEAIELGPHGEEDPCYIPRAEQLAKILAETES